MMRDRVFTPLGMIDTDFYVSADKQHRFATQYTPDSETGELRVLDRPDGWWSTPPKMPDANGWLVSTTDDLWAFASMLGAGSGSGLMMAVPAGDGSIGIPGGFGWEGGTGTSWRTDPSVGLTGILLTQRAATSPEPSEVVTDFWRGAYAAVRS